MTNVWIAALVSVSNNDSGDTATLHAAVMADTADHATMLLERALHARGCRVAQVEVIISMQQWAYDYPHEWDAMGLARQVCAEGPVAILPVQTPLSQKPARPAWLEVAPPRQITYLDRQYGKLIRKTTPDEVCDQLFRTGFETYAVLDASAVPMLPERLEASELDHVCLFRNANSVSERDNAPWLIRLTPDADLTRRLFTISGNPNDLGDRQCGIFLQSRQDISDVQSHLRLFTRLRDQSDQWFYFRFWSGTHLFALIEATAEGRLANFDRFFRSRHAELDAIAHLGVEGMWRFARRIAEVPMSQGPLILTAPMREELQGLQKTSFLARLKTHLAANGLGSPSDHDLLFLLERAYCNGITLQKAVADYTEAALRAGRPPETLVARTEMFNSLHQLDRAGQMLKCAKTMASCAT